MKKSTLYGILYLFLLAPFFKPPYFAATNEFINNIYNIAQIISAMITAFLVIKKRHMSKIVFCIILFEAVIILSTYLNDGHLKDTILDAIQTISLCTLVDYGLHYNKKSLIKGLVFLFEILLTINLLTIFIYPDGMYINPVNNYKSNWFLGFDNQHVIYILLGITSSVVYSYMCFQKLIPRTYYLIVVSTITIFTRWAATGLVGIALLLLYLILRKIINKFKFFNIKNYTLISLGLFLGIVIFRIQERFSYLIVDVLKKDLTFSGRTKIWDRAIYLINQHPYIGNGHISDYMKQIKYKIWGAVHAHNQILEITYLGGISLLIVFVLIIILMIKRLNKYRTYKITKFISWIIFIFMIMMLTEYYPMDRVFLLIVIACNIEYLIKE